MKRREIREQFLPWAGLAVGIVGTGLAHQFGSDGVFNDCDAASPLPLLLAALAGIALTVGGALVSWRVLADDKQGSARRLIATISVGAAALFVFAMLLPMVAALVLPPCFQ